MRLLFLVGLVVASFAIVAGNGNGIYVDMDHKKLEQMLHDVNDGKMTEKEMAAFIAEHRAARDAETGFAPQDVEHLRAHGHSHPVGTLERAGDISFEYVPDDHDCETSPFEFEECMHLKEYCKRKWAMFQYHADVSMPFIEYALRTMDYWDPHDPGEERFLHLYEKIFASEFVYTVELEGDAFNKKTSTDFEARKKVKDHLMTPTILLKYAARFFGDEKHPADDEYYDKCTEFVMHHLKGHEYTRVIPTTKQTQKYYSYPQLIDSAVNYLNVLIKIVKLGHNTKHTHEDPTKHMTDFPEIHVEIENKYDSLEMKPEL